MANVENDPLELRNATDQDGFKEFDSTYDPHLQEEKLRHLENKPCNKAITRRRMASARPT